MTLNCSQSGKYIISFLLKTKNWGFSSGHCVPSLFLQFSRGCETLSCSIPGWAVLIFVPSCWFASIFAVKDADSTSVSLYMEATLSHSAEFTETEWTAQ